MYIKLVDEKAVNAILQTNRLQGRHRPKLHGTNCERVIAIAKSAVEENFSRYADIDIQLKWMVSLFPFAFTERFKGEDEDDDEFTINGDMDKGEG